MKPFKENKGKGSKMYGELKRLTREEELAAWERGDQNALVESIWPFVMKMAREIRHENSVVYDELISTAGLVITEALRTFDPHKARFITYACSFIRYRMIEAKKRFERIEALPIHPQVACLNRDADSVDLHDEYEVAVDRLRTVCSDWQLEIMVRRSNGETHADIAASRNASKQASHNAMNEGLRKARKLFSSLAEVHAEPLPAGSNSEQSI